MTLSYTPRFHLAVPDFLSEPWHAEFAAAMESIDQALYTAIVSQGTSVWVNDHAYTLGDIIIDPETGTLYAAAITHTSSSFLAAPTFAAELAAHPTYWTSFAVIAASQAEAEDGIDNVKYMTPLRVAQAITAQSPTPGVATQTQAQEGTNNTEIMTPLRVSQATTARIASQAQAVAGTDNTTLMTPLRVSQQVVATGVAGGDTVGFSAHKNGTNQTGIAGSSVQTKLTFGTESYDLGSFYDTANSRWTPPNGQIHIDAAAHFVSVTSGTSTTLVIYKNGAIFKESSSQTSTVEAGVSISLDDIASGTDYYELFCYTSSVGPITALGAAVYSHFMGAFLGEVGTVTLGLAEIGFRASKGGTAQAGFPNSTWTKLTFGTEEYDQGALYDPGTSRWTAPTGLVHITAAMDASGAINVGGVVGLAIYKNGADLKHSTDTSASGGLCGSTVSVDDIASGTDYYEVFAFVQTGGPVSVDGSITATFFAGHRITGAQGPQGDVGPQGPSGSLTAPVVNAGRLQYVSSTALSFTPLNGDRIKINGAMQQIPTSGILGLNNTSAYVNGSSAQPLAANTLYYVYVFVNAGVLTADFSTTGHATSVAVSNEGIEIKAGDNSRTLIGMIRTGGTGGVQFIDTPGNRLVLSWFNRRTRALQAGEGSGDFPGNVWYETPNTRINFLSWGDECITVGTALKGYIIDTGGAVIYGAYVIDGAPGISGGYSLQHSYAPGGYWCNLSCSHVHEVSEGFHFIFCTSLSGAYSHHVQGSIGCTTHG